MEEKPMPKKKNKLLWSIAFVLIAAATVWAVTSQNRNFSGAAFMTYLRSAHKGWLGAAMLCALGFVLFEGAAVAAACRPFGIRVRPHHGTVYAAADIYFSAITPSATGGQPACAYFMMQNGISGMITTAALVANLMMYNLSIVAVSLFLFVFFPGVFAGYGVVSKLLILLGIVIQMLLVLLSALLLKNKRLLERVADSVLHFLCKIHLLRNEAEKREKLDAVMEEYGAELGCLRGKRRMLLRVFLYNFLQRTSVISVTVFVYLASGGSVANVPRLWAMQGFSLIGSNCVPIPGAMGVSDYLMLQGFGTVMPAQDAANLELLSRTLSFYSCIILCGVLTLVAYLLQNRRRKHARLL